MIIYCLVIFAIKYLWPVGGEGGVKQSGDDSELKQMIFLEWLFLLQLFGDIQKAVDTWWSFHTFVCFWGCQITVIPEPRS